MSDNNNKKKIQQFSGEVVSAKMAKTLVVAVERMVKHKVYGKQFRVTRRFKVHDEKGGHKVGDKVSFVSCRPLSRDKRWRVV